MYKENISATYNVLDIEIEELPPIYDRDTKNKAEDLERLHAFMKEKQVTTSNAEKLQILNFVSDSWSRKYGSEYFGVSENLIRSTRELQQRKGYLHNLPRKKVKQWPKKQLILFILSMRMMNTANSLLGKWIM